MKQQSSSSPDASPGPIAGLTGIAKSTLGLLINRIELAALEMGEVRANLARLLLFGALGAIAVWFALASWTALIVVLAWDTWGWKILLLIAALFTVFAGAIFIYARSLLKDDKLSMPATMAELRKDRDALL